VTHKTVREWGRVPVGDDGFTRAEANALLAAARAHRMSGPEGSDILRDHYRHLTAQQAVGVIAAPGCSLEILPKIDPEGSEENAGTVRARLVHMLDVALGLDLSSGETTAMAHGAESLLDIFIALFADRLLSEARRGLPQQYRAREEDLGALRGKLDVVRQFTALAVRPDRLACRFDALDPDVALMQVMKACVVFLARHARASGTQRKLAELRFLLSDVTDVPLRLLPWNSVRIDRTSQRWRALLSLARLLLGKRWQQTHADAQAPDGLTLLFPMNDLFERYVAVQLRRALADTDLEVVLQGGGEHALGEWIEGKVCAGSSYPTRPDILIRLAGRVAMVIDTKWKNPNMGIGQSDIYQMMAYARLYRCEHLVLLYPTVSTELPPYSQGLSGGTERLDIASVPLGKSEKHVIDSLRGLIAL